MDPAIGHIVKSPNIIYVAEFGENYSRSEIQNAVNIANETQTFFRFCLHPKKIDFNINHVTLTNGFLDLDKAAIEVIQSKTILPRPLILVSDKPYCAREDATEIDPMKALWFANYSMEEDSDVSIVSSYLWQKCLGRNNDLEEYLLLNFAALLVGRLAVIDALHKTSKNCICDYCQDPREIFNCLNDGDMLCPSCSRLFWSRIREGYLTISQAVAIKRLFNRAAKRQIAFLAHPFQPDFDPVRKIVSDTLSMKGYVSKSAKETAHPSRITDTIRFSILECDIMLADITESNPNVFYEVGWADASGKYVVLLTQDKDIPFDVRTEKVISYVPDDAGFESLRKELSLLF